MSDQSTEKPTLKQQIDGDEQLQKLGRKLSILSLLFMGVMLTGATIEEANTFVFKVKVTTQEAIPAMFLLSVIYLLFRYYTYARPYQKKIEEIWWKRFSSDVLYVQHLQDGSDEFIGLAYDLDPGSSTSDMKFERYYWNSSYLKRRLFDRSIVFTYVYDYPQGETPDPDLYPDVVFDEPILRRAGFIPFCKVYLKEIKYQLRSYVDDKERLDLWGPYLIAILAILSFFFRSDFQQLVKALVNFAST